MGLKQKPQGAGYLFLKVNSKEGCIQHVERGPDGEPLKYTDGENKGKSIVHKHKPGAAVVEGFILGMRIEDNEYQGNKTRALRIELDDPDGGPKMLVDFPYSSDESGPSFFALQLLAKINTANLRAPVAFCPWFMAEGTRRKGFAPLAKDKTGCVVSQGTVKLDVDYGGGLKELPKLEEVKVGKKKVKDKGEWDTILEGLYSIVTAKLEAIHGEETPE